MAVAVVADAHIGGPGGPAAPLLEQLGALPGQGCRHLVLLGDLFQAWIGSRRFETADIAATVALLRRLRAAGLRIDYIEGNRDFYLAGSPYADAFDTVSTEVAFVAGGRRVLAVHGDGLNDRDRQYLFWRWLSKSAPVRGLVLHLPGVVARRFVRSTEQRLAQTNFKHKARIPEEAIRAYAARRLTEGHDLVLLGHFHEPRAWQVGGGEVRLLEAWFSSRRIEWVG
ncbi:MAG: UDP-2,3-diacylglucosamine diphosphatase [Acidobacteriota bacterium]